MAVEHLDWKYFICKNGIALWNNFFGSPKLKPIIPPWKTRLTKNIDHLRNEGGKDIKNNHCCPTKIRSFEYVIWKLVISLGILQFQPYGFWDSLSGSFICYNPDPSGEVLRKSNLKLHYFLGPGRFFSRLNRCANPPIYQIQRVVWIVSKPKW